MSDLDVSLMIQVGPKWVELNDPEWGYELHKDTFGQRSVTHKKVEIESAWLEGTYAKRALRNNVIETVAVYCSSENNSDVMKLQRQLTLALDQTNFRMRLQIGEHYEFWDCQASDYTIESSQELLFAKKCLVRAQVPRLPETRRS